MPTEEPASMALRPIADATLRSDPQTILPGREYSLALRFNRKRRGLAAFDWVATWRIGRGTASRAFPLDAHGFAEALRGAAVTIQMETGMAVPRTELEIAGYKERRVNEYLRSLDLQQANLELSRRGGLHSS